MNIETKEVGFTERKLIHDEYEERKSSTELSSDGQAPNFVI